jgi:hypothetical protein
MLLKALWVCNKDEQMKKRILHRPILGFAKHPCVICHKIWGTLSWFSRAGVVICIDYPILQPSMSKTWKWWTYLGMYLYIVPKRRKKNESCEQNRLLCQWSGSTRFGTKNGLFYFLILWPGRSFNSSLESLLWSQLTTVLQAFLGLMTVVQYGIEATGWMLGIHYQDWISALQLLVV